MPPASHMQHAQPYPHQLPTPLVCIAASRPGSEYKIDASYLSPNVNLASRLEAATKQYSVPMLLSRDFVDCLSPSVRAKVGKVLTHTAAMGLVCMGATTATTDTAFENITPAAASWQRLVQLVWN